MPRAQGLAREGFRARRTVRGFTAADTPPREKWKLSLVRMAVGFAVFLESLGLVACVAVAGFFVLGLIDDYFLATDNVRMAITVVLWALLALTGGIGLHLLTRILEVLERTNAALQRETPDDS